MARYGTFLYGQEYYGGGEETTLLWALEIDWNDDDLFDGTNEASRMTNMQSTRGNDYLISSDGKGFDPKNIGSLIITLDNYDGRYDPYNTGSPLYGFIEPGKKARLSVKNGTDGTLYRVFTGIIQDIQPIGRRETVELTIDCAWRWAADRDANTELYQAIYADDAIEHILDSISWPSIWGYALDAGPDSIPYWWATGKKAKSEIEDVANSGIGHVFVANDGTMKYYSRQRNDDPVLVLTEGILGKDVAIPQPWENQRNIIKIQTHPRRLQSSQVIWTLQEKPLIVNGESITIWAEYNYENQAVPAIDVITPVATTDYSANTQEDGGGTDYTADISVEITKFSNVSKIVYTNNAVTSVYLTAQLRGKPINAPDTSGIQAEGAGHATHPRTLEIDLPWQQNYNTGLDLATYLVDFLSAPQPFPTLRVRNRPTIQYGLDLYDKVSLTLSTWGIDRNFRVGKISHRFMNENGQDVETIFKLFPVYIPPVGSYWEIGVSLLGTDTYLGV